MNIQAGKFYKTRNGRKARVYATDGASETGYEIHGAVHVDGTWNHVGWHKSGEYVKGSGDVHDLTSEWTEPALRPWKPEEVPLGAFFKHVGHDQVAGSGRIYAPVIIDLSGVVFATFGANVIVSREELAKAYFHSIDNGKTWLPCGMEDLL